MHIALSVVAGLLAGPLIHHVAVQAGFDQSFALDAAICRRCRSPRRLLRRCTHCALGTGRVVVTAVGTAAVSGAVAAALGPSWVLVGYLAFVFMTAALFLTDIDHKRIPNRISYPGTVITAALLGIGAWLDGTIAAYPRALLAALVFSVFFGIVYVIARGGFGLGDVKLAVSLGLFSGFLGWDRLFLAGMATAAFGGVFALVAVIALRAGAKTELPYGPPMILGTWLAIVAGGWVTLL